MNRHNVEPGNLLFPLSDIDPAIGRRGALRADVIDGELVPQPYRRLLVHHGDMTSTLEAFSGQTIRLRVLDKRIEEGVMLREVLLVGEADGRVLEFGAIRIELSRFTGDARRRIEACDTPLGAILRDAGVAFESRPQAFLRIRPQAPLRDLLGAEPGAVLFGRRNTLTTPDGALIARILEVLPPLMPTEDGA